MSTKAYSTDLRTRVINYIESGHSQREASKLFSVSKSAVSRWWNRYKEEGSLSAKPKLGSKSKVSAETLEAFVIQNPHKTLQEIGLHFGLKKSTLHKRLKNLGFRYKKKPSHTWKQTNTREPFF